jgi:hypothetical protein
MKKNGTTAAAESPMHNSPINILYLQWFAAVGISFLTEVGLAVVGSLSFIVKTEFAPGVVWTVWIILTEREQC